MHVLEKIPRINGSCDVTYSDGNENKDVFFEDPEIDLLSHQAKQHQSKGTHRADSRTNPLLSGTCCDQTPFVLSQYPAPFQGKPANSAHTHSATELIFCYLCHGSESRPASWTVVLSPPPAFSVFWPFSHREANVHPEILSDPGWLSRISCNMKPGVSFGTFPPFLSPLSLVPAAISCTSRIFL